MAQRKRRGFTIVELVIVIAVIAILAGVLIPTFASVIKKANEASDTALIKSLNTSLKADEVLTSKPATMHDALQVVKNDGYDLTKIKATASGNEILWDSVNNCFVYLKDNQVTYIPDSYEKAQDGVALWKIVAASDGLSATYSNYLAYATTEVINATTGLDVGENAEISVNYSNTTNANVIIRTNGGVLTVNATNGTVHHYEYAEEVIINEIAMDSYHEHGIVGYAEIAKGHFALESDAIVNVLFATSAGAKVSKDESAIIGGAYSTIQNAANAGNVTLTYATDKDAKKANSAFRGEGTLASPYLISSAAEFAVMRNKINAETSSADQHLHNAYYKLMADIDLAHYNWEPIGTKGNAFAGTFDGNGKTISNMTISKETGAQVGLFGVLGGQAVIKNVTLAASSVSVADSVESVALLVGETSETSSVVIANCKTTADCAIVGGKNVGGLVGHAYGDIKFENCTNEATVSGHKYAGGMIGRFVQNGTAAVEGHYAEFVNSTNNGVITDKEGGGAAGFIGGVCTSLNYGAHEVAVVKYTNCNSNMIYSYSTGNSAISMENCKVGSADAVLSSVGYKGGNGGYIIAGINGRYYATRSNNATASDGKALYAQYLINGRGVGYSLTSDASSELTGAVKYYADCATTDAGFVTNATDLAAKWCEVLGMTIQNGKAKYTDGFAVGAMEAYFKAENVANGYKLQIATCQGGVKLYRVVRVDDTTTLTVNFKTKQGNDGVEYSTSGTFGK